ncbi:FAD-binding oxidoreductase [Maricaulis sp.]|uniref:FAD-binding oxidoreductase n=1 Tax=Maricaulis sp. TaxID=1486257 RepID=UPI002B27AA8D|nr:FAD-binding protein [Maricaulis sp.]
MLIAGGAAAASLTWERFGLSEAANRYGLTQDVIVALRAQLDGQIVLPSDPSFEVARRTASFNPLTDFRPAIIIYCESLADIARGIEFARTQGLPLAARSGGCDILGRSSCDRGVVIDLSVLNDVTMNLAKSRAMIGAGATAGLVNSDLASHGLAVPLGCDPMVGVGGLTLGGGLGWLLGKHGTASDNMESATLVSANGDIIETSRENNPDLFWGLNGGGGNFGIVAGMTFRTAELGRVVGGYLVYSIDTATDFLLAYPSLMAQAPRELMVELASINTARGPVLVAMTCFSGPEDEAEAALAPFRATGNPVADDIGVRDYRSVGNPSAQMLAAFPAPRDEAVPGSGEADSFNHWRGCNLLEINQAAANSLVDAMRSAPPGASIGLGHFIKGAALEVTDMETAMPRYRGSICAYCSASWRYAAQSAERIAWVDQARAALAAQSRSPTYVNYLDLEDQASVQATYGANYARLSRIKSRWDPDNIFNNNRNIRPS